MYKSEKQFGPLDDLFILLEQLENTFSVTISDSDYHVGKQQLFYTFLHETMHAFVAKMVSWLYEIEDDETDFVDEVVARIVIDNLIDKLNLMKKINPYYQRYVNHKKELPKYGYELSVDEYENIEKEWYQNYSDKLDVLSFANFVFNYYKANKSRLRKDTEI